MRRSSRPCTRSPSPSASCRSPSPPPPPPLSAPPPPLRLVPPPPPPPPLNIDGFPLARIATGILEDGRWLLDPADLHAYNLRMPVYSAVWSARAGLAGLHPLTDLPWGVALGTSLLVLPGYLLGGKSTGHRAV